jgi:hypothetical protein
VTTNTETIGTDTVTITTDAQRLQKLEPAVQRPPARDVPTPFFTVGRIGLCRAAKAGAVSKSAAKWSVPMWRP